MGQENSEQNKETQRQQQQEPTITSSSPSYIPVSTSITPQNRPSSNLAKSQSSTFPRFETTKIPEVLSPIYTTPQDKEEFIDNIIEEEPNKSVRIETFKESVEDIKDFLCNFDNVDLHVTRDRPIENRSANLIEINLK